MTTAPRDDINDGKWYWNAMGRKKTIDRFLLASILAALVICAYLQPPIWKHGEAREGLVIQDIVRDQEWILPNPNGGVPSKPPLFHWIAALWASLFGLSDFTVRLPSVIAAEIMAITTFLLGNALGGRKQGWFAVGALLGMYQFWIAGTEARVDMVFAACVTVSIAGFFFWWRDGRAGARAACYLAAAAAVLAKGPAGIAFPALVIFGFLVVEKRLDCVWKFWSWPLVAVALFIDLGWYALAYRIGGSKFLAVQILRENLDQVLGTHGFSSHQAKLAVLGWIATRFFPWNLALVWDLIRRLRGNRQDSSGRFLHAWWIAIAAIVFLSTIKRAVYLLPAYPAIALLAARALTALGSGAASDAPAPGLLVRLRATLQRLLRTPGPAALSIAFLDIALVLPNPMVWKRQLANKRPGIFAGQVAAAVPETGVLSAAGEMRNPDLIVVAYRLQRNILRKPLACAAAGDYFLVPRSALGASGVKADVLAAWEGNDTVLIRVLEVPVTPCPSSSAEPLEEDQTDTD
jgi:4-amino-4-deoxy-L-arabinose transferase-like glycosyltransferase